MRTRNVAWFVAVGVGLLIAGCERPAHAGGESHSQRTEEEASRTAAEETQEATVEVDESKYPWLDEVDSDAPLTPLDGRFPTPDGYERVDVEPDSYGAFMRGLPLFEGRTTVRSFSGQALSSPAAAVVALDIGSRDLQQCADTIIRLHAEYLWKRERRDELAYHFTSGDKTRWVDWRAGERYVVSGSEVERVDRAEMDDSRQQFEKWLDTVFQYAGTQSLRHDSEPVEDQVEPGDFYVDPGSPGHAVVVLDVVVDDEGNRLGLLGQGFIPAQELHVIRHGGPNVVDGVWFRLPDPSGDAPGHLDTPSWEPFSADQVRRFVTE